MGILCLLRVSREARERVGNSQSLEELQNGRDASEPDGGLRPLQPARQAVDSKDPADNGRGHFPLLPSGLLA